jgi:hypothetical protein
MLLCASLALALVLPRSPLAPAVAREISPCRIALLCAEEPLSIGGVPVRIGDGVLCKDPESGAWWRASVLERRGSQILVHYFGCDSSWDAWLEATTETVMPFDAAEKAKEASAFQSDSYEDSLGDDEEILAQYRAERWDDNARWQLNTFVAAQGGEWTGQYVQYDPVADSGGAASDARAPGLSSGRARMQRRAAERCGCSVRQLPLSEGEAQACVSLVDDLPPSSAALCMPPSIWTSASWEVFRPERGCMAVAGAYSLSGGLVDSSLLLELAIREEGRRVRCKLLYRADEEQATDGEAAVAPAMRLCELGLVRETSDGSDFGRASVEADAASDTPVDLDGGPGRGLYDPPRGDKTHYVTLYCEGGITLCFPARVEVGAAGAISLDWVAGENRYQLDRKFDALDGSLAALELTEIGASDSEIMPPDFPHQGGGR